MTFSGNTAVRCVHAATACVRQLIAFFFKNMCSVYFCDLVSWRRRHIQVMLTGFSSFFAMTRARVPTMCICEFHSECCLHAFALCLWLRLWSARRTECAARRLAPFAPVVLMIRGALALWRCDAWSPPTPTRDGRSLVRSSAHGHRDGRRHSMYVVLLALWRRRACRNV